MSSHVSWFYLFIILVLQQICVKWDHLFVETAYWSKPEDTGGWFSCPMLKRFFFFVFNSKNIFISYLNILFSMVWLCSLPLLPLPPAPLLHLCDTEKIEYILGTSDASANPSVQTLTSYVGSNVRDRGYSGSYLSESFSYLSPPNAQVPQNKPAVSR